MTTTNWEGYYCISLASSVTCVYEHAKVCCGVRGLCGYRVCKLALSGLCWCVTSLPTGCQCLWYRPCALIAGYPHRSRQLRNMHGCRPQQQQHHCGWLWRGLGPSVRQEDVTPDLVSIRAELDRD